VSACDVAKFSLIFTDQDFYNYAIGVYGNSTPPINFVLSKCRDQAPPSRPGYRYYNPTVNYETDVSVSTLPQEEDSPMLYTIVPMPEGGIDEYARSMKAGKAPDVTMSDRHFGLFNEMASSALGTKLVWTENRLGKMHQRAVEMELGTSQFQARVTDNKYLSVVADPRDALVNGLLHALQATGQFVVIDEHLNLIDPITGDAAQFFPTAKQQDPNR